MRVRLVARAACEEGRSVWGAGYRLFGSAEWGGDRTPRQHVRAPRTRCFFAPGLGWECARSRVPVGCTSGPGKAEGVLRARGDALRSGLVRRTGVCSEGAVYVGLGLGASFRLLRDLAAGRASRVHEPDRSSLGDAGAD